MEAFLPGGIEQSGPQDFLTGVLRKFQVMDTRVDGGVDAGGVGILSHHGQPGVKVGQPTRREGTAACDKLEERLSPSVCVGGGRGVSCALTLSYMSQ